MREPHSIQTLEGLIKSLMVATGKRGCFGGRHISAQSCDTVRDLVHVAALKTLNVAAQTKGDETGETFAGWSNPVHTRGEKGAIETVFLAVRALGRQIGPAARRTRVKERRGVTHHDLTATAEVVSLCHRR